MNTTIASAHGTVGLTPPQPSPSAIRMRRLRQRRQDMNARVVALEIDARDCAALWKGGFFVTGESAATREHVAKALRRLLDSIRDG